MTKEPSKGNSQAKSSENYSVYQQLIIPGMEEFFAQLDAQSKPSTKSESK